MIIYLENGLYNYVDNACTYVINGCYNIQFTKDKKCNLLVYPEDYPEHKSKVIKITENPYDVDLDDYNDVLNNISGNEQELDVSNFLHTLKVLKSTEIRKWLEPSEIPF